MLVAFVAADAAAIVRATSATSPSADLRAALLCSSRIRCPISPVAPSAAIAAAASSTCHLVLTYVMLGWGLNIVVGLAGLLDLGYVAFYAVGAYSFALIATTFRLGFWVCLPLAGILAALWGIMLGFPVLRLRGDYLAIVTLAFGEIIRIMLLNWDGFTGGPNGISDIPRPTLLRHPLRRRARTASPPSSASSSRPIHRIIFLYYVILALALITNFVTAAPAPAADRPRLGGAARGRDRLPLARHQHHQHQAHGLRHRRHVRRLRRHPSSPRGKASSPRELQLYRIGHHPRDRRAGRPGQPARRRHRRDRHVGCIERCFPRLRFRELRAIYRMLIFGLAMVADHGLAAARPRLGTRTPSIFLEQARRIPSDLVEEGTRMKPWQTRPAAHGRAPDHALRRAGRRRRSFLRRAAAATSPRSSARTAPARPRCSTASPASTSRPRAMRALRPCPRRRGTLRARARCDRIPDIDQRTPRRSPAPSRTFACSPA